MQVSREKAEASIDDSAARAAAAIWNWRKDPAEDRKLALRRLRRQGNLQAAAGVLVGALVFFFWHRNLSYLIWGIALLTFLAANLSPTRVYRRLASAIERLGDLIGKVLTALLLVPVFFLFFTVFGKLLRRGSRDRLKRNFDQSASSYWRKREPPEAGLERYKRQF